jgi:hypothetical protein
MAVTIAPPVRFPLGKPLRILITIPLESVRHFAPSAATWAPGEPPDVIQAKARDTVAVIAHEALMGIFDPSKPAFEPAMLSLALDPARSGVRTARDDPDRCDAVELRYDYRTKGTRDPPVLLLQAENGPGEGHVQFGSDVPEEELRKEANEACAAEDKQV